MSLSNRAARTGVSKQRHYETLLRWLGEARAQGFHLQAVWLACAIIEDRTNSALRKSRVKPGRGLGKKLRKLSQLVKAKAPYRQAFSDKKLLPDVKKWVKRRNHLMHELANVPKDEAALLGESAKLGENGDRLAREVASAGRRLKKRLRK